MSEPLTMSPEREAEFWKILETSPRLWLRYLEDEQLFDEIAKSLRSELNAERAAHKRTQEALAKLRSENESLRKRVKELDREAIDAVRSEPVANAQAPTDAAKLLSSLGASKGGRARAVNLTPEARKEIARTAARTRWNRGPGQT